MSFQPDWTSPPGATILDVLKLKSITLDEFADLIAVNATVARRLTEGTERITSELANRLELHIGGTAAFWVQRDHQYLAQVRVLADRYCEPEYQEWLEELPIKDMVKYGWLRGSKVAAEQAKLCLEFFGVSDVAQWRRKYRGELAVAAFRTSAAYTTRIGAVAAWLRKAELESDPIVCAPWDKTGLAKAIPQLRQLTRLKDPQQFVPLLRASCAQYGVAVVVVPAPDGCRASGATRFLSSDRALVALSWRYRSDDQFWFSFFHEIGHLLLHSKKALFLEDESDVSMQEEAEANAFAANVLIPNSSIPELERLRPRMAEIIRFAWRVGVSPGIVVGQLQHRGVIGHHQMNGLKRRLAWE